jgi:hypothetical protein
MTEEQRPADVHAKMGLTLRPRPAALRVGRRQTGRSGRWSRARGAAHYINRYINPPSLGHTHPHASDRIQASSDGNREINDDGAYS